MCVLKTYQLLRGEVTVREKAVKKQVDPSEVIVPSRLGWGKGGLDWGGIGGWWGGSGFGSILNMALTGLPGG